MILKTFFNHGPISHMVSSSPFFDLTRLTLLSPARVHAVSLEPREIEWLRAIGIFEGQEVTVLRRAPLGGPLHVRTGSGGEFALCRSLALSIHVHPKDEVRR